MRLLVIEPIPNFGGGSEAITLSVSRELARRKHEVFLLHQHDGTMLGEYQSFCKGIYRFPIDGFSFRKPWKAIGCVNRIGELTRKYAISAAFTSNLGLLRIGALVKLFYGIPFCFHLGLPCIDASYATRLSFKHIGAGIAPSIHTQESWLSAGWPKSSLYTIQNWVDAQKFRPTNDRLALRRELALNDCDPSIVYVGRVVPEKGLESLYRAFSKVKEKIANARLVIVGGCSDGYDHELERLQVELGLPCDAVIRRQVTLEPEKYFAAADIVCVPSSWAEPFGLVLIEAMACGVPVLATSVGMMPQIMGDVNLDLIVAPEAPIALAEKLVWWLHRPQEAAKRGLELRQRVVEFFSHQSSMDQYEYVLEGFK